MTKGGKKRGEVLQELFREFKYYKFENFKVCMKL